jgi:hypothetical protein
MLWYSSNSILMFIFITTDVIWGATVIKAKLHCLMYYFKNSAQQHASFMLFSIHTLYFGLVITNWFTFAIYLVQILMRDWIFLTLSSHILEYPLKQGHVHLDWILGCYFSPTDATFVIIHRLFTATMSYFIYLFFCISTIFNHRWPHTDLWYGAWQGIAKPSEGLFVSSHVHHAQQMRNTDNWTTADTHMQ